MNKERIRRLIEIIERPQTKFNMGDGDVCIAGWAKILWPNPKHMGYECCDEALQRTLGISLKEAGILAYARGHKNRDRMGSDPQWRTDAVQALRHLLYTGTVKWGVEPPLTLGQKLWRMFT